MSRLAAMPDTFTIDPSFFLGLLGALLALVALYFVVRLAIVHALRQYHRAPEAAPDDWQARPTT